MMELVKLYTPREVKIRRDGEELTCQDYARRYTGLVYSDLYGVLVVDEEMGIAMLLDEYGNWEDVSGEIVVR